MSNAPIAGQPAAIVAVTRNGPYLARFPHFAPHPEEPNGEYVSCMAYAVEWRNAHAPAAIVLDFTGRQLVENIFNGEAR